MVRNGKESTLQMPKIHTTIQKKLKLNLLKLKKELQAKGVQFPIHLDKTIDLANKAEIQGINSMKQSIESVLGADNVVIDVHQLSTEDYDSSGYLAQTAAQKDLMIFTMVVGLQTIKILQLTSISLVSTAEVCCKTLV